MEDNTAKHINDPSVVKVANSYFMYFTRAEKFVIDRINVAASKDGLKWDVVGVAIDAGKADAWDSLSVGLPSVIHDEGMFKMWYDGRKDFPTGAPVERAPVSNESHRFVGYALLKTESIGFATVMNQYSETTLEESTFSGSGQSTSWSTSRTAAPEMRAVTTGLFRKTTASSCENRETKLIDMGTSRHSFFSTFNMNGVYFSVLRKPQLGIKT